MKPDRHPSPHYEEARLITASGVTLFVYVLALAIGHFTDMSRGQVLLCAGVAGLGVVVSYIRREW